MSTALLIARREFGSYFRSWMGPVLIAGALLVDGLWFNFNNGLDKKLLSGQVLTQFFYNTSGVTMIAAIVLTIRSLAEERQSGTLVLLNTSPVKDRDIVIGKFLAAFGVLAITTLLSAYMPAWIFVHGKVAMGHVVVGYVGLLLLGAALTSIGIFGSALATSQMVAVVISTVIAAVFVLLWMVAKATEPPLNQFLSGLAVHHENFRPFMNGILLPSGVVFYVLFTYAFLFASIKVLEARRWQ
ncbi:MAG: putative type transport system permease protein [Polyangiaceae bacterium]|jgi:ABC-2 type transport system permease protein|nr:putative type transport system permease protein [Polyangiaceae bacterium]